MYVYPAFSLQLCHPVFAHPAVVLELTLGWLSKHFNTANTSCAGVTPTDTHTHTFAIWSHHPHQNYSTIISETILPTTTTLPAQTVLECWGPRHYQMNQTLFAFVPHAPQPTSQCFAHQLTQYICSSALTLPALC
jgi:hypothetical protein